MEGKTGDVGVPGWFFVYLIIPIWPAINLQAGNRPGRGNTRVSYPVIERILYVVLPVKIWLKPPNGHRNSRPCEIAEQEQDWWFAENLT